MGNDLVAVVVSPHQVNAAAGEGVPCHELQTNSDNSNNNNDGACQPRLGACRAIAIAIQPVASGGLSLMGSCQQVVLT